MKISKSLSWISLIAVATMCVATQAQPTLPATTAVHENRGKNVILLKGPEGVVTEQQLQAAVEYLVPPQQRESFFSKPQNIEQMALSIYTRKAFAQAAEKQGFNRDASTAAILEVARNQTLSDLWVLKQIESKEPSSAQLEQYARSIFEAQPAHLRESTQLKVKHILISPSASLDDAQAKAKAEKLLSELKGGASFDVLAQEHSNDQGSAAKGGELPVITIGQYRSAFEAAAQKLTTAGELSEVVKGGTGYHIIQLVERKVLSGFDRQRDALMEQAKAKLSAESRAELFRAAQAGAVPDVDAISSLVRAPK